MGFINLKYFIQHCLKQVSNSGKSLWISHQCRDHSCTICKRPQEGMMVVAQQYRCCGLHHWKFWWLSYALVILLALGSATCRQFCSHLSSIGVVVSLKAKYLPCGRWLGLRCYSCGSQYQDHQLELNSHLIDLSQPQTWKNTGHHSYSGSLGARYPRRNPFFASHTHTKIDRAVRTR